MAIGLYPKDRISTHRLINGKKVVIRPVKPEDVEVIKFFLRALSGKSKHFNYMEHFKELTPAELKKLTHIDYTHKMTFIACSKSKEGEICLGMARYVDNPKLENCEFDVVIADDWQNKGIGTLLLSALIQEAKEKGIKSIKGIVPANNKAMIELAHYFGFQISANDDPLVKIIIKKF